MDQNEFFRKAALRLCGNLKIEEALFSTFKFLRRTLPVDWMAIEYLDGAMNQMRTIAIVDSNGGESVDLMTHLSDHARNQAEQKYRTGKRMIYLFEHPEKDQLAREMLSFHGVRATSLMVVALESGGRRIGTWVLASQGEKRLSGEHADLLALLSEPTAIALSNTLKHRSELKLLDKEFFWEITTRICGNLEIEEGLRACIEYLSRYMPADSLYLERYESELGAMRFVARARADKGEKIEILVPLFQEAKTLLDKRARECKIGILPPVTLVNNSDEEPIARHLLEILGEPPSSVLGIPLVIGNQPEGSLVLLANGNDRFNEEHARLFSNLSAPFYVALANTLKHREILELKDLLADDNRYLQNELRRLSGDELIGADFGLKEVMNQVRRVAALDSPVLLLGETGVGKDVIANTIHYGSSRGKGPFVTVNCGAIPDTLIDSELFGHEKGAFTGALSQKRGRFERANGGTIFLDEIGELPPQAQVRLLRVLQSKEIERVGGAKTITLDIRIIAATNRDLEQMVKEKKFREDLWFRLNVFPIQIPPLRERKLDIPALVQYFIGMKVKELKLRDIPNLARGVMDVLMEYRWPGNVRELENVIERALILHRGEPLRFDDLGFLKANQVNAADSSSEDATNLELDALVKQHIQRVLDQTGGKIHGPGGAGDILGVNPNSLRYKMKKLGIPFRKQSQQTPAKMADA